MALEGLKARDSVPRKWVNSEAFFHEDEYSADVPLDDDQGLGAASPCSLPHPPHTLPVGSPIKNRRGRRDLNSGQAKTQRMKALLEAAARLPVGVGKRAKLQRFKSAPATTCARGSSGTGVAEVSEDERPSAINERSNDDQRLGTTSPCSSSSPSHVLPVGGPIRKRRGRRDQSSSHAKTACLKALLEVAARLPVGVGERAKLQRLKNAPAVSVFGSNEIRVASPSSPACSSGDLANVLYSLSLDNSKEALEEEDEEEEKEDGSCESNDETIEEVHDERPSLINVRPDGDQNLGTTSPCSLPHPSHVLPVGGPIRKRRGRRDQSSSHAKTTCLKALLEVAARLPVGVGERAKLQRLKNAPDASALGSSEVGVAAAFSSPACSSSDLAKTLVSVCLDNAEEALKEEEDKEDGSCESNEETIEELQDESPSLINARRCSSQSPPAHRARRTLQTSKSFVPLSKPELGFVLSKAAKGSSCTDHEVMRDRRMHRARARSERAPPPRARKREPVMLHIYDLGHDSGIQNVNVLLKALGTGAFHTGVQVYGDEWSFGYAENGTGVFRGTPKMCASHSYLETVDMGWTLLQPHDVQALLTRLEAEWRGSTYDLFERNCCHFSDMLCRQLRVGSIPTWVTTLAAAGSMLLWTTGFTAGTVEEADEERMLKVLPRSVLQQQCRLADNANFPDHLGKVRSRAQTRKKGHKVAE